MLAFSSLLFASFAGLAAAQAITSQAIDTVEDQFDGALLTPDVITKFDPEGVLNVVFPSAAGTITNGQKVPKDDAASQPSITFSAPISSYNDLDSGLNRTTTQFTVMMVDADYPGAPTVAEGINAHWISNDWTYGTLTNGVLTFTPPTSEPIIKYAGPGPASGSGPHRYVVLVFAQPEAYSAPAVPASGGSVTRIRYNEYTDGLGASPIAAVYFTVEVGTSTVQVSSTSAVSGATSATGSTAGSATGTGTGTTRPTGTASGTSASTTGTTTSTSSAMNLGSRLTGAGVAGVAVFVAAALFA
jgi:phosphatidylethanolamine-binding protein (PEBP) family uncharacterized protein